MRRAAALSSIAPARGSLRNYSATIIALRAAAFFPLGAIGHAGYGGW